VLPCYFHTEEQEVQVLIASVQSLAAQVTWHPGFVQPCFKACVNYIFPSIYLKIYRYQHDFTYLYSIPYVQNVALIWPKISHNRAHFYTVYSLL